MGSRTRSRTHLPGPDALDFLLVHVSPISVAVLENILPKLAVARAMMTLDEFVTMDIMKGWWIDQQLGRTQNTM